jgi:hypothetical protein
MLVSAIEQKLMQIDTARQIQPKQLRMLCQKQEQEVMHHLRKLQFDIYAEMERVCPSQANLRAITNEELIARINSVGQVNNFAQEQNPSPKSDLDEETDMLTEEQEQHHSCFPFDQPSINNFLDL